MSSIVLLAFASDRERDLPAVGQERTGIQKLLTGAGWDASLVMPFDDGLFQAEAAHKNERIRIFHYGGHAFPEGLQFNPLLGKPPGVLQFTYLAQYFKLFSHLKLVFLNGCATEDMAQSFLDNNAQAVISTRYPVRDDHAMRFARTFYYHFIDAGLPLRQAFDAACAVFAAPGQTEPWLDEAVDKFLHRGAGFSNLPADLTGLYRLNTSTPAVEQEKAADWMVATTPAAPNAAGSPAVRPDCYLLCNRQLQTALLERAVDDKLRQQRREPVFCFIHDEQRHCPPELFDRFLHYTFPGKFNLHLRAPNRIDLPTEIDLTDGEKSRGLLTENYCRTFGAWDEPGRRWQLPPRVPDDQLLVVHHPLAFRTWNADWETFFDWYLNQGADYFAQNFSGRLLVFCTRNTRASDAPFQQYLQQRAAQAPYRDRLLNLTGLTTIIPQDVDEWQQAVFQETRFLSDELFDGQPELDFLTIKDKLKKKATTIT